jgi:polyisoprenoid-binding protein YceI
MASMLLAFCCSESKVRIHEASANGSRSAAFAITASATSWTIDKVHSRSGFNVAHFVITQMTGFQGQEPWH